MPPIITVLNPKTGKVVKSIPDIGGADMVAYDPKRDKYYTGSRDMPEGPVLGVIDARTPAQLDAIRDFAAQWGQIVARRAFGDAGAGLDVDLDAMEQVARAAAAGLTAGTVEALL